MRIGNETPDGLIVPVIHDADQKSLLEIGREIDALAVDLLAANKVWIIGYRISQSFATYLYWQLIKLVPDIAVVPNGGESLGEHVASVASNDLVIYFALRRRMAGTEAALSEISATGARIALI